MSRLTIDSTIALILLALLWVVGAVFVGDPVPVEDRPVLSPPAYVHPVPGSGELFRDSGAAS